MTPVEKSEHERQADVLAGDRQGIRRAVLALAAELGCSAVTLDAVLERAGLDRSGFEQQFPDLDAAFVAFWEEIAQEFLEAAGPPFAAAESWRDGMRAAAWALCRHLQEDPARACFSIELTFSSDLFQARRDFVMDAWVELIHLGRFESSLEADLPRSIAEGVIGAIWERLTTIIRERDFEQLPKLIPEGMYLTVLPYLGPEAAQEELRRGPADIARYRGEPPAPPGADGEH